MGRVDQEQPRKLARAGGGAATPPAPDFEEQLEQARAYERSGAFDEALATYRDMARLDPRRREPLQGLRRLYSERGSWDAVLQVAELEIGLLARPEERARLLSQMARIWERELGDPDQAQQLLARARDERAHSSPAREGARPLVDPDDPATRVQRAWLAAARGDSEGALTALHEALAEDPSDVEALDMMLTVLEGAERHAEMADLLERRATLAADDGTRAVVLARLGALRETQQADLGSARSAYERALEADPGNRVSRSALQRIYRRTEAWTALRALLEAAAAEGSPLDRAAASAALGALFEQELGDPKSAEAAYREALRHAPEDAVAQDGLRRLRAVGAVAAPRTAAPGAATPRAAAPKLPAATDAAPAAASSDPASHPSSLGAGVDDREAAAARLELLRTQGDVAALVALLRVEVQRAPADQEFALQAELAGLLADRDAAGSLPHARRAAALAPLDVELLEQALAAAQAAGGPYAQLDLLDDLIATAPDPGIRAQLLARRGDVLCDGLDWSAEAAHCWRQALEADPRHARARARLVELSKSAQA
jgi:tetratricopeptide (TPR) repeat protein